jgi:SpoVK/Ycf46/Vps4 family AAA+-type ATPase
MRIALPDGLLPGLETETQAFVDLLQFGSLHADLFSKLGQRPPSGTRRCVTGDVFLNSARSGILLYGPSGCGKSTLVQQACHLTGASCVFVGPAGMRLCEILAQSALLIFNNRSCWWLCRG